MQNLGWRGRVERERKEEGEGRRKAELKNNEKWRKNTDRAIGREEGAQRARKCASPAPPFGTLQCQLFP